ncbi:tetratricopeptide repeat protein [Flagellimonas myxillae]|uniref:tetratricopeptide repeat protein n=1 Tax=Flagellimonas myxillae TaxID=2942214 RepID=UPI00201EBEF5|nr:tetratricopeptide repeat protein [Muricauda myxillae]MCL6267113.1 tetratricopeptide repeat protein [Muricauda myxillae]
MKSSLLYIVFTLLIASIANAQHTETLDSLLKVYQTQAEDTSKIGTIKLLFDNYLNNDLNEAEKYVIEELELSQKLDYKKGVGMAYLHFGVLDEYRSHLDSAKIDYTKARIIFRDIEHHGLEAVAIRNFAGVEYNLGNYDEALKILDEGIATLNKHSSDSTALIPFYHNKGLIHNFKGNYRIATQEVIKELRILEKLNRPIQKADALNLLANTESIQANYEKSIEYNLEALKVYREFNDKLFEVNVLNDIGLNYYSLENYEQAIVYLEEALEVNKVIKNQSLKSTVLTNLGNAYAKSNRPSEAIDYISKGIETAEKIGAKNKMVEGYNALAAVHAGLNNNNLAISYYSKSIEHINKGGSKANLSNAYKGRSELYARLSNHKLAYDDHLYHKQLSDSIYNNTKSQQIGELKTIYEIEKKEQQIAMQEKDIAVLEKEAQISYQQKLLLGGGLGLALIVLGLGFYGFRQKVKRNKLEKEKVDAQLAFKKKELTTHALHLAKKNEVLESVKLKARALKEKEGGSGYQELIKTINFDQQDDKNWESFTQYFEQVHKDFATNVKKRFPEVTKNELRFMALMKMNMSSKEIATILNISTDGIKKARQRLRKKMGLSPNDSLENIVLAI